MGCDIHMTVEVNTGDRWEGAGVAGYGDRNYRLFAKLAGVRNGGDITPISQPRGLPEDVSYAARRSADSYGVDGHSHSWLSLAELLPVAWPDELTEWYAPRDWLQYLDDLREIHDDPHCVRIVFFFDN